MRAFCPYCTLRTARSCKPGARSRRSRRAHRAIAKRARRWYKGLRSAVRCPSVHRREGAALHDELRPFRGAAGQQSVLRRDEGTGSAVSGSGQSRWTPAASADPRGNRKRQGTAGPVPSQRETANSRSVRRRQLRRHSRDPRRIGVLRLRARRAQRGPPPEGRPLPGRRSRDDLSRRGRPSLRRPPGPAAQGHRGPRGHSRSAPRDRFRWTCG